MWGEVVVVLPFLVVQVPGIGGSVLARRGVPVWDLSVPKLGRIAVHADLMALGGEDDGDDELVPVGLVDTMTVIPGLFGTGVRGDDQQSADVVRLEGWIDRVAF